MSPSRPRALTLDVTGTLIHSPGLGRIYQEVLHRHGIEVKEVEVVETFSVVWQEMSCRVRLGEDRFTSHPQGARGWWWQLLRRLCELLDKPMPSRFAASELFDRFTHAAAWEVFPEVAPTLQELLRRKVPMAVVANWDERLPGLLERLKLLGFFQSVVYSGMVSAEKPHAKIFQQALRDLQMEAPLTLHVGDDQRQDVEGAEALGMQALLLNRGGPISASTGKTISDLASLLDVFQSS